MDDPSYPDILKRRLNLAIHEAVSIYKEENRGTPCFSRNRVFTMEQIINLLIAMHGGSLNKELYAAGIKASPSAFSQQRGKVPLSVFEDVLAFFNQQCRNCDAKTFKGYRVYAVDGTTVNMARNPNSESFMRGRSGSRDRDEAKGYNQLHVTPLYDIMNKTYKYCVIQPQPKQDEVGALTLLLYLCGDLFEEPTLIVGDRGYESYNTFAYFQEHDNIDFLIRVKNGTSGMKAIRELPLQELDTDVAFTLTTTQTKADKANGNIYINTHKNSNRNYKSRARRWIYGSPYDMKFRVVRVLLDSGEYETLATSLPRSVTADEIKELYHSRWGIETAFRELKYAIGLVNLHGKKDAFVRQEIYAAMLLNNLASRVVNHTIIRQQDCHNALTYKVNQKMAVYLCREFLRKDSDGRQLMEDIARYTEAVRPDRSDTRNIRAQFFRGFIYRVSA